jgi:hypothetical protein
VKLILDPSISIPSLISAPEGQIILNLYSFGWRMIGSTSSAELQAENDSKNPFLHLESAIG